MGRAQVEDNVFGLEKHLTSNTPTRSDKSKLFPYNFGNNLLTKII